ncbi:MAG: ESX-1 secretion-associated protein [Mycobacterium sp.]|nr:ESX-1 secretion-associated protein [Mycobacterium sp.]
MAERITVVPAELRRAAQEHRLTADYLNEVPAGHAAVLASLEALGPVFAELREAGRELLDERRACYQQQAAAHADLADRLSSAADVWEQQDAEAASRLGTVGEEHP